MKVPVFTRPARLTHLACLSCLSHLAYRPRLNRSPRPLARGLRKTQISAALAALGTLGALFWAGPVGAQSGNLFYDLQIYGSENFLAGTTSITNAGTGGNGSVGILGSATLIANPAGSTISGNGYFTNSTYSTVTFPAPPLTLSFSGGPFTLTGGSTQGIINITENDLILYVSTPDGSNVITFAGGRSSGDGGAIRVCGPTIALSPLPCNGVPADPGATDDPSAATGSVTVNGNLNLTNNSSARPSETNGDGGAIWASGSVTVNGTMDADGNIALGAGGGSGGVINTYAGDLTITGAVKASGNMATSNGGALAISQDTPAYGSGAPAPDPGAWLAGSSGDIVMTGNAASSGGALWGGNFGNLSLASTSPLTSPVTSPVTSSATSLVTSSSGLNTGSQVILANNAAVRQGGAIGSDNGDVYVGNATTSRVQITGNWVAQIGRAGGGAIFSTQGTVAVLGKSIELLSNLSNGNGNAVLSGGGGIASGNTDTSGNLDIIGPLTAKNNATSGVGGALFVSGSVNLDTTDAGSSVFSCNIEGVKVTNSPDSSLLHPQTGTNSPGSYTFTPQSTGSIIPDMATTANADNGMTTVNAIYLSGYNGQTLPSIATLIARENQTITFNDPIENNPARASGSSGDLTWVIIAGGGKVFFNGKPQTDCGAITTNTDPDPTAVPQPDQSQNIFPGGTKLTQQQSRIYGSTLVGGDVATDVTSATNATVGGGTMVLENDATYGVLAGDTGTILLPANTPNGVKGIQSGTYSEANQTLDSDASPGPGSSFTLAAGGTLVGSNNTAASTGPGITTSDPLGNVRADAFVMAGGTLDISGSVTLNNATGNPAKGETSYSLFKIVDSNTQSATDSGGGGTVTGNSVPGGVTLNGGTVLFNTCLNAADPSSTLSDQWVIAGGGTVTSTVGSAGSNGPVNIVVNETGCAGGDTSKTGDGRGIMLIRGDDPAGNEEIPGMKDIPATAFALNGVVGGTVRGGDWLYSLYTDKYGVYLRTTAFSPLPPTPVPTLGQWALAALALLVAGVTARVLPRRRAG